MPGHGPVCDTRYLDEQGAFIQEWVDYVRRAVDRGLTKDEAVKSLTAMTDRYPMDIEQDGMAPRVMQMNVANLYDYVTGAGIHRRAGSGQTGRRQRLPAKSGAGRLTSAAARA